MRKQATCETRRCQVNEWRTWADVWGNAGRSVSKIRESMSRLFENRSETRGFCSAGFFTGSRFAPEPVVFSRATHNSANHGKRCVAVKSIFFRLWTSYFSKSYTNTLIFAAQRVCWISGSILSHLPPARPQPMRGMWTEAESSSAFSATEVRHCSMAG
ncbi:hypothetical protein Enr17x_16700 [Gimesia fumaroli]|uniref:Uncharacterized protein n=1 Tax=Gimesia fumaroli TaxID=2527976 RepID=A0A518I9C0_9PLAN|nr:hypothetical protein Enr17x_16700 [Gimesia fumaroli]